MLAWISDPYFSNPRAVNFVPPVAEPVDQHPEENSQHSDQHMSSQQPNPTASTSSSSSDAEQQHHSPASNRSPDHTISVHLDDTNSGNTVTLHLSQPSEASTNFSGPCSESPLITRCNAPISGILI
ncbi:hypothetical protein LXL04_020845 [Taraxacum kok-saghyz]